MERRAALAGPVPGPRKRRVTHRLALLIVRQPHPTPDMTNVHRLASIGLTLCAALAAQDGRPAPARIGDPVPDFAFPTLHNGDGRVSLHEFRGRPVLLDFWGTR